MAPVTPALFALNLSWFNLKGIAIHGDVRARKPRAVWRVIQGKESSGDIVAVPEKKWPVIWFQLSRPSTTAGPQ